MMIDDLYYDILLHEQMERSKFLRKKIARLESKLRQARVMNINLLDENHKLRESIMAWIKSAQGVNFIDHDGWVNCVLDGIEIMSKL